MLLCWFFSLVCQSVNPLVNYQEGQSLAKLTFSVMVLVVLKVSKHTDKLKRSYGTTFSKPPICSLPPAVHLPLVCSL